MSNNANSKKKILKPQGLIVLSLFDGMSCGRLALEKAGIKIDKYLASEIKDFAINHTLERYPDTISIGDVTKIYYDNKTKTLYSNCEKQIINNVNASELTQEEIDEYIQKGYEITLDGTIQKWIPSNEIKYQGDIDILIGGSPCFVGDTLVLTKNGLKHIKDIKVGDFVLTHNNIYEKVTNVMNQGFKNIFKIKAMNFDEIETTFNHKFLVRKKEFIYDKTQFTYDEKYKRKRYKRIRTFGEPEWKTIEELMTLDEHNKPNYKNYYVGSAINQNSIIPQWNGTKISINQFAQSNLNNLDLKDENLWYIVGRYLGDGLLIKNRNEKCRNNINGFKICCAKDELDDLKSKINENYHYCVNEDKSTYILEFSNTEFANFLAQFGEYADGKFLPGFVFDMPINLLKAMLDGYFDTNESYEDENWINANSVSKNLIYGIALCINKVYKKPTSINKVNVPPTKLIEGRKVNQKPYYKVRFSLESNKNTQSFFENNYIWYPISEIIDTNKQEEVFDISVENSHSFMANNCLVHNCQNFSMANSFQNANSYGLAGEKSRLFYEYARIKEEVNPTYFFLENVKMKKQAELQLNDFMKVNGLHINSNTLSIQHRDRIYWTNIRDFKNLSKNINDKDNNIPQPNERTFGLNKKTGEVASINFQDYLIKTLPKFEPMLYIKKYPMCYDLFTKSQQQEMDKYVEKDTSGNVIYVNFDIDKIEDKDIEQIINIPSNIWIINELEETRKFYRKLGKTTFSPNGISKKFTTKHPLTNKDIVYIIHFYLMESLVKKTPSRDKMWNNGLPSQFACKNITNENKISCLTRKQDRFPNSGLISFGYYCRFVNRFEICKAQTVPFYYLNDLTYSQIQDVCGDGWTVDSIRYILGYLKQIYEF